MENTDLYRRALLLGGITAGLGLHSDLSIATSKKQIGRRLILIELSGANDSLNTLVPHRNDTYYRLRPSIALKQRELVNLSTEYSFNSALTELLPFWEKGELGLIQGLGYKNPNRSHFKSKAIWETGGDGSLTQKKGWLTHDIEHKFSSIDTDLHGISMGGGMGMFTGGNGNWMSSRSLQRIIESKTKPQLSSIENETETLRSVRRQYESLHRSSTVLANKLATANLIIRNNQRHLSAQLQQCVELIKANVNVPVIKTSLAGFDTHRTQKPRQRKLLRQLAESLTQFKKELVKIGEWNNVVIVTHSEFGRRVKENKSGGTDHGTAATHFVLGGNIQGGFYGDFVDLENLIDDDLKHTMDYRAVYAEILHSGFDIQNNLFSEYRDARLHQLIPSV